MIRFLLLALACAAALACATKKEGEGDKATPAAESAPENQPAEPPADKPAEPPAEPAATAAPVDCEKLFTADDIAEACGLEAADLEVRKHAMETGKGATTCVRQAGPKGKRTSSIHFALNSAPGSPDRARALLDLSKSGEGAKAVDVGDGAYLHVRAVPLATQTVHDLEVVKGAVWFKLGYDRDKGEKKPLCSDDGLQQLGKTVAGRLP